jgi:hypothetical protein
MKLTFHCIIMAISNACVLHNDTVTKKLRTSKFIQQVHDNLAEGDKWSSKIAHLYQEGMKKAQLRCAVCSDKE